MYRPSVLRGKGIRANNIPRSSYTRRHTVLHTPHVHHALREVNLLDSHTWLRENLGLLQQAAYCAALVEQTTETDTPLPAFFALFDSLLASLAGHEPLPQTVFAFELKLLQELGLSPDWQKTKLTPGARQLLEKLLTLDWAGLARLRLSPAQTAEIRHFLHGFLVYHLGKLPATREQALLATGQTMRG